MCVCVCWCVHNKTIHRVTLLLIIIETHFTHTLIWKDRILATRATAHWLESQQHRFLCKHKSMTSSLTHPNLFRRLSTKMFHLVAGCVMEGSMVFCQKNILERSMRFQGDYLKRCLLTHRVSQIWYLVQLISEIKYIAITANGLFSTLSLKRRYRREQRRL